MSASGVVKVYSGLSVRFEQVRALLPEAEVASPAARGDIRRDVQRGVSVIALIDGRFDQHSAVSPSELLDALRAGVRLYGSSSMGSLRAAELAAHGMIGHGVVFERIRRALVFKDDRVGQTFDPVTQRVLSHAHVDIELALERAVAEGRLSAPLAQRIEQTLAALPYADRTLAALAARLGASGPSRAELAPLFSREESQKQRDGLSLLERVRRELEHVRDLNEAARERARRRSPFIRTQ